MPIDPAQLRARATDVAVRLANPEDCVAAIRRVLTDYADLTRRYSPRLAESAPANVLNTPTPVLRALGTALRRPARAAPAEALAVANRLWAGGSREERRLAAELAGVAADQHPAEALAGVEAWLPTLTDPETAEAVVHQALGPLISAEPTSYLQRAGRWAKQRNKWVRRAGVTVVEALARDRRWDDVPAALELLRTLMGERDPVVRHAVVNALTALIQRAPLVVTRFLREQARRSDHNTHYIVRAAMRALPPEAQAELIQVMRL